MRTSRPTPIDAVLPEYAADGLLLPDGGPEPRVPRGGMARPLESEPPVRRVVVVERRERDWGLGDGGWPGEGA